MIETAVIDFIKQLQQLPDPILTQFTLDDIPMARRQAGYELCAKLHQLQLWSIIEPDARQSAIRELLRDVTVYPDHLEMAFVGKASSDRRQQEVFNLIIPLEIKSSIRRHSANTPTRTPTPLQTALAQAYIWRRLLDNGQYPDIGKLAAVIKFDPSYVTRTLNLTLLSPDLITKIMQGGLLADLPLSHLPNTWPLSWTEQRQVFSSLVKRNCTRDTGSKQTPG